MEHTTNYPKLDTFTFPTFVESYEGGALLAFPSIQYERDTDDGGCEIVENPVVQLIRDGKEIEAVELLEMWIDDHIDCANVAVTVEGKKYGFSMWYAGRESIHELVRAQMMHKESVDWLKEYIVEYTC